MPNVIVQGVDEIVAARGQFIDRLKRSGRLDHPAAGARNGKGHDPVQAEISVAQAQAQAAEARAIDALGRSWTDTATSLRALIVRTDRFIDAKGKNARVNKDVFKKLIEAEACIRDLFPAGE